MGPMVVLGPPMAEYAQHPRFQSVEVNGSRGIHPATDATRTIASQMTNVLLRMTTIVTRVAVAAQLALMKTIAMPTVLNRAMRWMAPLAHDAWPRLHWEVDIAGGTHPLRTVILPAFGMMMDTDAAIRVQKIT